MKLLVLGNPALSYDSLAITVGEMLKEEGHAVEHIIDPLELLELDLSEVLILDVAEGISEPLLVDSVDKLRLGRLVSLHDFDAAYFLKLREKLGKGSSVRILALPIDAEESESVSAVKEFLKNQSHNI